MSFKAGVQPFIFNLSIVEETTQFGLFHCWHGHRCKPDVNKKKKYVRMYLEHLRSLHFLQLDLFTSAGMMSPVVSLSSYSIEGFLLLLLSLLLYCVGPTSACYFSISQLSVLYVSIAPWSLTRVLIARLLQILPSTIKWQENWWGEDWAFCVVVLENPFSTI